MRTSQKPLFDANWYAKQIGADPIECQNEDSLYVHYQRNGRELLYSPHPLFYTKWVISQNNSVMEAFNAGIDPREYFISHGASDQIWPHPLFNTAFYVKQYAPENIRNEILDPLTHYMTIGWKQGLCPHLLFDTNWYVTQAAEAGGIRIDDIDPLSHFVQYGAQMGCSPHPLFDAKWYLEQNADAMAALKRGMDPLSHFIQIGAKRRYWPHPMFDVSWYLENNLEARIACENGIDPLTYYIDFDRRVDASTHQLFDKSWYTKTYISPDGPEQNALLHFIKKGMAAGNHPARFARYDGNQKVIKVDKPDLTLSPAPLVSIIVVNLNGEGHLDALVRSIKAQSYENYELIFVDNGSSDLSVQAIGKLAPETKIIKLETNVGFAAANNMGLSIASGELIALLNNDTRLDVNWLENLVFAAQRNPDCAALTSKVLFWEKFAILKISSNDAFTIDKEVLLASLAYKKVFVDYGTDQGHEIQSVCAADKYNIILKLPVSTSNLAIRVSGLTEGANIQIDSKFKRVSQRVQGSDVSLVYSWSPYDKMHARYVINNAGSAEHQWLEPGDIGYGQFDAGQFNVGRNVDLICGCAVVIKRAALRKTPIFFDEFFAYYEDSELSKRLRRDGFDLIYVPGAIVYHKHSSTSVERSAFWHKYVRRNKIVYDFLFEDIYLRDERLDSQLSNLNHLKNWMKSRGEVLTNNERQFQQVIPEIIYDLRDLCLRTYEQSRDEKPVIRIGVYNKFWNTKGGGEAHVLKFVSLLQAYQNVELISTEDFEVSDLSSYFSISLHNVSKRIVTEFNPAVTSEYDLFLNSTYMDETPSLAKNSYYIVSFPSHAPSPEFLASYKFIPNSEYTLSWMKKYWGDNFEYDLVFPTVSPLISNLGPNAMKEKEKIILSVGRFFKSGHSKNQLQIVQAFKQMIEGNEDLCSWKLVLVGSVNDQDYFNSVCSLAETTNCQVIPNASFDELGDLYNRSFIYVHAAGLGKNPELEPADFEHFGMTVAEAAANGCYPVVYNAAGPAEIVDLLGAGLKFDSVDDLSKKLEAAAELYRDDTSRAKVLENLRVRARMFDDTVQRSETLSCMLSHIKKSRVK
ncbi:glycosyltransferase [Methylorubrum extorquens]|uniref:glycosyltransferase n=1 Tax=Methylorubrum extorquens TaxID=408 RepID=UPI002237D569|nr:glycosyltransferase [Methylorubrum extorquens]UYW24994.1 glycosyltransferase [Methylorubrum extorquens]